MKIRLKFLKRFINWVGEQFEKLSPKLQKVVEIGVKVTDAVKEVVSNPALDFITALIKTGADDEVISKIRSSLPSILKTLGLIKDSKGAEGELLSYAVNELMSRTDKGKALVWKQLSALLIEALSDGELSEDEAYNLAKWYYDEKVKGV